MPTFSLVLCSLINKQLTEQLKVYYSSWQVQLNVRESMSITSTLRQPIMKAARDPTRSKDAPTIPLWTLAPPIITKGFNIPDTSSIVTTSSRPAKEPVQQSSDTPAPSTATSTSIAAALARDQIASVVTGMAVQPPQVKVRNSRTCMKCGRDAHQCLGHADRKLCSWPCQDCGEMTCKGRNAKRPKRTCKDGWEPIVRRQ
jgi:hypothetical protein